MRKHPGSGRANSSIVEWEGARLAFSLSSAACRVQRCCRLVHARDPSRCGGSSRESDEVELSAGRGGRQARLPSSAPLEILPQPAQTCAIAPIDEYRLTVPTGSIQQDSGGSQSAQNDRAGGRAVLLPPSLPGPPLSRHPAARICWLHRCDRTSKSRNTDLPLGDGCGLKGKRGGAGAWKQLAGAGVRRTGSMRELIA